MNFTPTQQQAIDTVDCNLCVSAGAGSGKTSVLVERFLQLVIKNHVSPQRILAMTYTEKAANEMKKRLVEEFEKRGLVEERQALESAYIGTIHSLCARFLRENPIEAQVSSDFAVLNEETSELEANRILDELIELLSKEERFFQLFRMYGAEQKESELRKSIFEFRKMLERSGKDLASVVASSFRENDALKPLLATLDAYMTQGPSQKQTPALVEKLQKANLFKEELLQKQKAVTWALLSRWQEMIKDFSHAALSKEYEQIKIDFDHYFSSSVARLSEPLCRTFLDFYKRFQDAFQTFKTERCVLDFSDLLLKTHALLAGNEISNQAVRERYQKQFDYIHVDEYQDTNLVQDEIICLLSRGHNLFIVGDVKQSIYAFQGAQVEVFEAREKNFKENPKAKRLALNENFRSQATLLDWINSFFLQLWKNNATFEALQAQRKSQNNAEPVKMLFTVKNEEETLDEARIREARQLAFHLKELLASNFEVEEKGQKRALQYQDITILFQTLTNVSLYENELRKLDLPYYVVKGRGFYERQEIRDLTDMLSVINHPLDDFSLAAVLRSPLVGINEDTLFWLSRLAKEPKRSEALYVGLTRLTYQDKIVGRELEKLQDFLKLRSQLEKEKHYLSLSEILKRILNATFYEVKLLGSRDGVRCYANVQKLLEMARSFEQQENVQLIDFIHFIENCSVNEAKESEAALELEQGQVIRLMTIHQAKGLEFPVVAVADLGAGRRVSSTPQVVFLPNEGVGWKVKSAEENEWIETPILKKYKAHQKAQEQAEQKRLLYVAMTRAREHLILSGVLSSLKWQEQEEAQLSTWAEKIAKIKNFAPQEENILEVESFSDSKFPKEIQSVLREQKSFELEKFAARTVVLEAQQEATRVMTQIETLPAANSWLRAVAVSALMRFEKCPLSYFYRYGMGFQDDATLYEEEQKETVLEDGQTLSAADFGTLFHRVMQFFDFQANPEQEMKRTIEAVSSGLSKTVKERLEQSLKRMLENPLLEEIRKARSVHREMDFLLKFQTANVRGQIDMLFQNEKGEWILLDYKTSRIPPEKLKETALHYQCQMELYALACQNLSQITVSKAFLVFTELGTNLEIEICPNVLQNRKEWINQALDVMSGRTFRADVSDFCNVCGFRSFCPQQTLTT